MKIIQSVSIIGSGTMGAGIATVCARAGFPVNLYDIDKQALDKARLSISENLKAAMGKGKITPAEMEFTLKNIRFTGRPEDLISDLCIEAVVEDLKIKKDILIQLAALNKDTTIIASNTSSIPITQIAKGIPFPERILGMHFFNPAPVMKLVEIVAGLETKDEFIEMSTDFTKKLNKVPVRVKDSPGFIVNRVARNYYVEALKILEENITSLENIDSLMESTGFKMGPFRLMDLIGVDTNFSVTTSIYGQFFNDPKFRPSRIQKQKVDAGHWGKKTGKGFYDYRENS